MGVCIVRKHRGAGTYGIAVTADVNELSQSGVSAVEYSKQSVAETAQLRQTAPPQRLR